MWLVATVLDSVGYEELQPIEIANQGFTASPTPKKINRIKGKTHKS